MAVEALHFDANATYGLIPEVWERLSSLPGLDGNPSSIHLSGQRARGYIEDARDSLKALLGCRYTDQIIFTSGATEANNALIHSLLWQSACLDGTCSVPAGGKVIVTTVIEHAALLAPLDRLRGFGFEVIAIDPGADGSKLLLELEHVLTERGSETALVSIMAANNETGLILPLAEAAALSKRLAPGALVHSDGVQIPGKLNASFTDLGIDFMSISGHKFGALTGCGALVARRECAMTPYIVGGPQERSMRSGTENVPGIASMGIAAELSASEGSRRVEKLRTLRDRFEVELVSSIPDVSLNNAGIERLPNTSSIRFPGIDSNELIIGLDLAGVRVSAGSACSSGKTTPSYVLTAMGLTAEAARETIRVSLHHLLDESDVRRGAAIIAEQVRHMKSTGEHRV